ncbi:hypothetical protein GQ44DRAFT_774887 [Phaeosphaeriaceae sp. PMI808]|nr:hypothetical protein GQ44DRAFT_774887 [Phaeosphaeriaceae sp. PMI808]
MSSKLVPDYEVKVLLDPSSVLESNNKLKNDVTSAFNISSGNKKMNVQFVDTNEQDIYKKGWNLRIRKSEGDEELELTYKKRYEINAEFSSAAKDHIDAALQVAQQEGFDSTTRYEAQVEVGYRKQTLSISYSEEVSETGLTGMSLPLEEDSRKFLSNNAPDNFKNWSSSGWGTDQIAKSIIYGPVNAKRYKGTLGDIKLFIEVWLIRTSKTDPALVPIVEASFKTPDLEKALKGRAKLIDALEKPGWFLPGDALRTKLIMERYGSGTVPN